MMRITISVNKEGLDRFRQLGDGKVKECLKDIVTAGGELIKRSTLERYDAEVTPDYAPWSPLRPYTLKRKGGRGKMLVVSGSLRKSIRKYRRGPLAISIRATKTRPGEFHQSGTPKMVARPFMGISTKDALQVQEIALNKLRALILN